MQDIISVIGLTFGTIMKLCYDVVESYGFSIILFTLISKVILLPVSLWVHKNGLKVVRMQPEINRLKIDHYGDKDAIADGTAELYKREKYNPLASLIPLAIQIIILMGVIEVIYHPLTYLLGMKAECVSAWLSSAQNLHGIDIAANSAQLKLLGLIHQGQGAAIAAQVPEAWQFALAQMEGFDTRFLGVDLTWIASEMTWIYLLIPIACGLSSLFLSLMQNRLNPLQHEQDSGTQWGTLGFSVGLSLYLGYFVPAGVALYWIAGNLLAVVQQILLNLIIDPRKHVDYEALEKTRTELNQLKQIGTGSMDPKEARALRKRENADYKRFFSVVNKHLVFYSEGSGFYKYYKGYIEYLLKNTKLTIHYITSDPKDQIFGLAEKNPKIRPYYIGEKKLITLMMKMDADVVCMTMPDLENFHIKRSYVRKDIEYIYIPHGAGSHNLVMRKGCKDHYDTIFLCGPHEREEEEQKEEVYNLPKRKLLDVGYPLFDEMRAQYNSAEHPENPQKKILIAPSWQKDNIIDSCLDEIVESLKGRDYEIIIRPHPQEVRMKKEFIEGLKQKYELQGIEFQTDFSSNNPLLESDLLITDWSGTSQDFAYTTLRPVLFINTPMKVMNPEYQRIKAVPLDFRMRKIIGKSLDMDQLDQVGNLAEELLGEKDKYREQIDKFVHENLYNVDTSTEVGGAYIVKTIQEKIINKEKNNEK